MPSKLEKQSSKSQKGGLRYLTIKCENLYMAKPCKPDLSTNDERCNTHRKIMTWLTMRYCKSMKIEDTLIMGKMLSICLLKYRRPTNMKKCSKFLIKK